jgi:hypothetical protein
MRIIFLIAVGFILCVAVYYMDKTFHGPDEDGDYPDDWFHNRKATPEEMDRIMRQLNKDGE